MIHAWRTTADTWRGSRFLTHIRLAHHAANRPSATIAAFRFLDRHPELARTYQPQTDPSLRLIIQRYYSYRDYDETVAQLTGLISSWRFDHPLKSESSWSFLAGIVAPISIDIEDCLPFNGMRGSVPPSTTRSPSTSFDDAVEPRTRAHHSDNAGGGGGGQKKRSGNEIDAAGKEYEEDVRRVTGGKSAIVDGAEIDSVTDEALIQAKDINPGKPGNFLKKEKKKQIKRTIESAQQRGLRAEFWFKKEPFPEIREYIESRGGIVVIGLGD